MKDVFGLFTAEYDAWFERNRYVYLSELNLLKAIIPQGAPGLEIGVGTGRFAGPLGIEFGLDPSINMLKVAKERGIKVIAGVGENLPFKNEAFELVLIVVTICFVNDPLWVLSESYRVLKKEGEIVIGFIDKNSFLGKIYEEKKKSGNKFYKDARFYSPEDLAELLKKTGFRDLKFFQTLYNIPSEIETPEEPLEGFGKGGFVVVKGRK